MPVCIIDNGDIIICPIAIAYSMGQITKSVCVCQSVCLCVCPFASTLTVVFLDRFSPKLAQTLEPRKVRTSSLGVNMAESTKIPRLEGNRGRGTRW